MHGAQRIRVTPGKHPLVSYALGTTAHDVRCALVVGADGRTSTVRTQLGIPLQRATPTHTITGLLVDGVRDWPQNTSAFGTEGDVMFLVFPQGGQCLRLYCCTALAQRDRFAGRTGATRLLEAFQQLSCLPFAASFAGATAVGPCVTYSAEDTWTDVPFVEGAVLLGDAAGYNDPIIGQGLSLAFRDVRVLSDLLLASRDWTPQLLQPYAAERQERMRRVRVVAALIATLNSEFGSVAAARRARFNQRLQTGEAPGLQAALAAVYQGPETAPELAFDAEALELALS